MADKQIRYRIDAEDAPFLAAIKRVDAGLRGVEGRVGGAFTGITGSFARISGMVAGVGALLTGGAFAAGISNAINLQEQMYKGAQRAGLTTEAFSSLAYAAKLADVPVETLEKSMAKLSSTLVNAQQNQKEAVELFRRLKLDPKNVQDADALLLELAQRFEQMPDGINKTALAVDVFGEKLGPRLIPFLNQGRAGIQDLREEAKRLGVVIDSEAGKQAEQFKDNLEKLKTAGVGASNAIATELVPSLVSASEYFVKATKDAGLLQGTLISIGALMAKVLGIDEAGKLQSRIGQLNGEVERLRNILVGVENVLQRDPNNDMAQRRFANLTAKVKELNAEILKTSVELARLSAGNPEAGGGRGFVNPERVKGPVFSPDDKKPDGPKKTAPDAPDSYMAYYREMLAEEERAQTILTQGREYGKAEELAFWQFILANAEATGKDRVSILRRTAELETDIVRQAARQKRELDLEAINGAGELASARLEAERAAAESLLATGEITAAQMLAMDASFEERRYQIRLVATQQRLQLLASDPDSNPAERRRLQTEIELLEVEHQQRLAGIKGAQKADALAPALNVWASIEQSSQKSIEGILGRTQSLRQGLAGIWAAIRGSVITELAKIGVAKLAAFAKERLMTVAEIGMNATKAGAGAAASQAAIPVVGPALALAAMATILAAVGGLSARVPSAERGWSIPAGVNPLTQLHEQEMVLPKAEANAVRDMAGGGGGSQLPQIVLQGYRHGNFFITEIAALAKALEHGQRNFHIKR